MTDSHQRGPSERRSLRRDRRTHRDRRRHRRRRRSGGVRHGGLPGDGRPGRPPAGEDRLPPREGLRRRADPARGQASSSPSASPRPRRTAGSRTTGLRIIGGGMRLSLPWPDLASFPPYGLVRTRPGLRRHPRPARREARRAAARGHQRHRPDRDDARARSSASTAKATGRRRAARPAPSSRYTAPLVVAADGNSSRLSLAMGREKREDRPMGVAVRTYYTSPRHDDDYLESWLELWSHRRQRQEGAAARLRLDLRRRRRHLQRRPRHPQHLQRLRQDRLQGRHAALGRDHAARSGPTHDETMVGPIRGAALPMGFNRQPHYDRRPAARRRRRRHGQPVQRRGHRLRHGVRPARGRGHRPGVRPHRRRRSASGSCSPTPG